MKASTYYFKFKQFKISLTDTAELLLVFSSQITLHIHSLFPNYLLNNEDESAMNIWKILYYSL